MTKSEDFLMSVSVPVHCSSHLFKWWKSEHISAFHSFSKLPITASKPKHLEAFPPFLHQGVYREIYRTVKRLNRTALPACSKTTATAYLHTCKRSCLKRDLPVYLTNARFKCRMLCPHWAFPCSPPSQCNLSRSIEDLLKQDPTNSKEDGIRKWKLAKSLFHIHSAWMHPRQR